MLAHALGQEQVVEEEQVWCDPALEQLGALCVAGQGVVGELGVGLQVTNCAKSTQKCELGHPPIAIFYGVKGQFLHPRNGLHFFVSAPW